MGVQVLGTILNTCVSEGDGTWGIGWKFIDKPLRVLIIGNVKIAYGVLTILMGFLLRNIFPDPDTICRQLKYYQYDACKWFCELTLLSARDGEVLHSLVTDAETREDMIVAIRHRDEDGSLLSDPTTLISLWEELVGDWPSITKGGPRYLLQVRDSFIHQCGAICRAEVTWKGNKLRPIDEDDKLYLLFGMNQGRLRDIEWRVELESDRL